MRLEENVGFLVGKSNGQKTLRAFPRKRKEKSQRTKTFRWENKNFPFPKTLFSSFRPFDGTEPPSEAAKPFSRVLSTA